MSRLVRVLLSVLVVSALGGVGGLTTYAVFSHSTENTGNTFAAGTVAISDNDAGAALATLADAGPGDSSSDCITIEYSGSAPASLRLYGSSSGGLASHVTLTITRGSDPSPSFSSCGGFTADSTDYIGSGAGVVFSGTLSSFPSTYGAGIEDPMPGSPESWTTGEKHAYRYSLTVQGDLAGQGQTASATLTWEARS